MVKINERRRSPNKANLGKTNNALMSAALFTRKTLAFVVLLSSFASFLLFIVQQHCPSLKEPCPLKNLCQLAISR